METHYKAEHVHLPIPECFILDDEEIDNVNQLIFYLGWVLGWVLPKTQQQIFIVKNFFRYGFRRVGNNFLSNF